MTTFDDLCKEYQKIIQPQVNQYLKDIVRYGHWMDNIEYEKDYEYYLKLYGNDGDNS